MARTKSSKTNRSNSNNSQRSTGKSASRSTSSEGESASSGGSSNETSFARAKDYVESNLSLQTAGIALAGAGILALVATPAGRSLIKTATDAVVNLVSTQVASFSGSSSEDGKSDSNTSQRSSRQRDQARV